MIQLLATRYNQFIASLLLIVFECSFISAYSTPVKKYYPVSVATSGKKNRPNTIKDIPANNPVVKKSVEKTAVKSKNNFTPDKGFIGGPGQPEMSSFKSVGTDNMVNLFTGDFSYNIPLLDVGGYPVNIFYDGGISPEQEASWVGLGWNINPGTVSRNMRGVPDDFKGDELEQTQDMKPNLTIGAEFTRGVEVWGLDGDVAGLSVGRSLNFSYNNYLGPAFTYGAKIGLNFEIGKNVGSEKSPFKVGAGLDFDISTRDGVSLSPNLSLSATAFENTAGLVVGAGLSTTYNSRTGIKQLQISEQMSYNFHTANKVLNYYGNNLTHRPRFSTAITFAKPSYLPALRMPITNESYSGSYKIGGGGLGFYTYKGTEAYFQKAYIRINDRKQTKPLYGYLHYEEAKNNPNAVMDLARFNDNEVTPNTPIISAPQYTYDVFSIQGEGTGGSIRAYRNDLGYVRDNTTHSRDKNISGGVDISPGSHYGANYNTISTPTVISEWTKGNKLKNTIGFKPSSEMYENFYFRNPGESSVLHDAQFENIGGTDLVRFKLGGSDLLPTIEPFLERFSKSNDPNGTQDIRSTPPPERKKRTQVTSFLTAKEASEIGLDHDIKNFSPGLDNQNNLMFTSLSRFYANNQGATDTWRKPHHISQINVTEANGRRYIYGLPVYNIEQKDFSFTVTSSPNADDRVTYVNNTALNNAPDRDGYLQITRTPAYAHSFLLTALLSPDYVDINDDGITEDDLGDAVKFNYTRLGSENSWINHKWRTPLGSQGNLANFNDGNLSEKKDDKGMISYGERESWYLHSIESKTMIALFTVGNRQDGKGVEDENSGVYINDNSQKKLEKIDLYSKSDLKKNGLGPNGARPIKTVWFDYAYSLCPGTPDNPTQGGGKLTLAGIYFTFNGKTRTNKNKYVFSYSNQGDNPSYTANASDRWGNYKPATDNPNGLKNKDYPYVLDDKVKADKSANAWALKKILLPSGGQIEVEYESDDYAYVQNKRAATMMEIVGFGSNPDSYSGRLYNNGAGLVENNYVFIKVPEACTSKTEVFHKYLNGVDQLAFKLAVTMPKGMEYITAYATIENYNVSTNDSKIIWVKLNNRNGLSPLTLTALDYLRQRLPGQAYLAYDLSDQNIVQQVGTMVAQIVYALYNTFSDPIQQLRREGKAKNTETGKSFVRLNDPNGYKYGGGQRVKSVTLKDNWEAMTGQYTSKYGQQYNYETTEIFNGAERTISSGVASYEPSIGGEENPFYSIVEVADKLPLGPASYGAIEMPMMDAFFPAPVVGYSKVTVRSLGRHEIPAGKKTRSGIGKQVTEFYTAKDFPVYYNYTQLDPSSDKGYHDADFNFIYSSSIDSRALSQGFVIETNDMHGKLKSQSSYAEGDEKTRINYSEHFYRNTGANGLNEKFDFIYASKEGKVEQGSIGVDIELMTDTREFSVKTKSRDHQGNLDFFPAFIFPWIPSYWHVSGNSDNIYRAVTTTKVVNYHAVLDKVVVIDKGSMVTTKNLVYDSETGEVVVSRTENEFEKPIYNVNYPAYWAHSGMSLAYKNIDAVFTDKNFVDGKISGIDPASLPQIFESGDELYIMDPGGTAGCAAAMVSSTDIKIIWAVDRNKTSALTNTNPDFIFIDKDGRPYTRSAVDFRIVRSGKRNMLHASVSSIAMMLNPIDPGTNKISFNVNSQVINASALEYKEKWQTDKDIIKRYKTQTDPVTCEIIEVPDCSGYLEKRINPYRKGLLGNFKPQRSKVFYGSRTETDPLVVTNLSQNGFLSQFNPYWNFNGVHLIPSVNNNEWLWNNETVAYNSKGMELETKDALEIYTAAQYGFNKTLPVAIANNSRYNEMFSDGFEDVGYNETLNGVPLNECLDKHINFENIFKDSDVGVNAHTGQYVMKVPSQNTYQLSLPVSSTTAEDFNLNFGTDVIRGPLFDEGAVVDDIMADPDPFYPDGSVTNRQAVEGGLDYVVSGHTGMRYSFTKWDYEYCIPQTDGSIFGIVQGYSGVTGHQYVEIKRCGEYQIDFFLFTSNNSSGATYILINQKFKLTIRDLDGNLVKTLLVDQNNFQIETTLVTYLDKGIFLFSWESSTDLRFEEPNHTCGNNGTYSNEGRNVIASFALHWPTGQSTPPGYMAPKSYKSLATLSECPITKPIAATNSMMNPVFTIPAGKKMLFSAWVKQDCSTNCTNKVEIDFGNGITSGPLTPSGPVIEGWQRIENYFTAPLDVTTATLKFVNNSSNPIYFDDLRIHPFNANMKSYVYDPVNLRLVAEMDANNYASFYEYDEEGTLVRTKAETKQGIKTITETRSFKQVAISDIQP